MSEKGSIKIFFHRWWKWLTPSVLLAVLFTGTLIFQTFTVTTVSASPATLAKGTSCQAIYSAAGVPQGFIADMTITNTGVRTLHHWKVQVIFPDTPILMAGWNGIVSQQGNQIIIKNTPANAVIAPGASINPGFDTTWNNDTTTPSAIKLNGVTCSLTVS